MYDNVYIPPHQRDHRYPLWFVRYPVTVPHIQLLSIEEIEEGLPTSGDPHNDHASMWEPLQISLPVHRMAELWAQGANIYLVNAQDSAVIYKDIQNHLVAWKTHIEGAYNTSEAPIDDLLLLDQFASQIYEHAKFVMDEVFVSSFFKGARAPRFSRRNDMKVLDKIKAKQEQAQRQGKKYKNFDPDIRTATKEEALQKDYGGRERIDNHAPRKSMADVFKRS